MLLAAFKCGETVAIKYDTICIASVNGNIIKITIRKGVSLKKRNWKERPANNVEIADKSE